MKSDSAAGTVPGGGGSTPCESGPFWVEVESLMGWLRHDGRITWGRLRRLGRTGFVLIFLVLPFTYLKGQTTVMGKSGVGAG